MKTIKTIFAALMLAALISSESYSQQYQPTNKAVSTVSYDQSETAISVDPTNSNLLMATWNDDRSNVYSQPGYSFSTDGGNSWSSNSPLDPVPGTYDYGVDPSCALDAHGNMYYTYLACTAQAANRSGPFQVYISRTTDDGAVWGTAHPVSVGLTNEDKPYMAVDNTGGTYDGRIYVAWTDFTSGAAIDFAYSTDQGKDWQTPGTGTLMATSNSPGPSARFSSIKGHPTLAAISGSSVQFGTPAVGPDGTVYVVFLSASGGTGSSGSIELVKSTDGGKDFNSPEDIANTTVLFSNSDYVGELRVSTIPTIAVDPSSGSVYVAYTQDDNGDYNIYYVDSTAQSSKFSSPAIATQTTTGLQFQPWLTVNSTGVVSLDYYQGTSTSADVYEAESYNDGASFYGSDTKLTTVSGNPSDAEWSCDYIGATSTADRNVFALWSDFRSNSNADVYAGLYNSATRLAYNNTSFYGGATGNNNNRTIAQGNYLYETFMSGGDIFLRRSTDDGSTWDITTRLSDGSGENSKPSAAVYTHGTATDTVCVVWQKNLGNSYFDIEEAFSGNSGESWTSPQLLQSNVLVSSDQYAGAQPVIASASYSGVQQPPPATAHSPTINRLDSQKRADSPAIDSSAAPLLPAAYTHRLSWSTPAIPDCNTCGGTRPWKVSGQVPILYLHPTRARTGFRP
ncbi:MAG: glycoside hydrolase [Bacteroidetes bacterium]|nr:glycoside hydrolase [Bacteroidota bacterium]